MKTKKCFKCNEAKELDQFYKHSAMSDGHLGKCKECTKKDVGLHRAMNIERIRQYDRIRGGHPHRKKASTERAKKNKLLFPEKYKAQTAVNNAVRDGRIPKPEKCSLCGGNRQIEGHHDDYSKPLEVVWLCSACHSKYHHGSF